MAEGGSEGGKGSPFGLNEIAMREGFFQPMRNGQNGSWGAFDGVSNSGWFEVIFSLSPLSTYISFPPLLSPVLIASSITIEYVPRVDRSILEED